MNPTAAEITEALKQIRSATGMTVSYSGGQWSITAGGKSQPVSGANAAAFDSVLQQTMLNMRAAKKPAVAPASSPASHPASFWQRAVSGIGTARIGGSVLSLGARVGGALGAGGIGGAALGIGGMALGAVTTVVGGVIRTIVGVVSTGFSLIMRLVSSIISTGLGLIRTVVTTAVAGLVAVFGVLVATTLKARDALTTMARSINDLRGSTGMSAGRAGGLINRFNAFGINPETTAGMFENSNPLTLALRARMMGGRDMGDIEGMARRFQSMSASGPFGNRMARNMLGEFDTAEFRRVLMQPIALLRNQAAFQNKTQASLGVDPAMIARVGQETDALTNKFRVFMDTALIRLASEVLPFLNQKFEQFTNYLVAHAPDIAKAITTGVDIFINTVGTVADWLTTNGPAIGKALQSGIQVAWQSFISVADWLYSVAPKMVLGGLSFIVNGLASFTGYLADFLRGVQAGTSGFNDVVKQVLLGASYLGGAASLIGNAFKGVYNAFAFTWNEIILRIGAVIYDGLLLIAKGIVNSPLGLVADQVVKHMTGSSLTDRINRTGLVNPINDPLMRKAQLDYLPLTDTEAIMQGPAKLYEQFNKLRGSDTMTNAISMLDRWTASLSQKGAGIDAANNALGTAEGRSTDFKSWIGSLTQPSKDKKALEVDLLKQIADNTKQIALNSDPRNMDAYHRQAMDLIKAVVGQDAADQYMMLSRT